jgi:hypothetical protein
MTIRLLAPALLALALPACADLGMGSSPTPSTQAAPSASAANPIADVTGRPGQPAGLMSQGDTGTGQGQAPSGAGPAAATTATGTTRGQRMRRSSTAAQRQIAPTSGGTPVMSSTGTPVQSSTGAPVSSGMR